MGRPPIHRRSRLAAVLAAAVLTLVGRAGPAWGSDEAGTTYYLALGDSVAQGYQPDAPYPPYYAPDGYVLLVYAALSANAPKLALDNISCGGEGTASMIEGSQDPSVAPSCGSPSFYRYWYPHKTQLADAVSFLAAHKEKVDLVTIDIGGNDLGFCLFGAAAEMATCLADAYATVAANLDVVLTELQDASPDTVIVGMTMYNPLACLYFFGAEDTAAFVSAQVQTLNAVLVDVYAAHDVPVADVASAFSVGSGLEAEATAALKWTWFCSADYFGDVHPNDAGHEVIAQAFLDALPD